MLYSLVPRHMLSLAVEREVHAKISGSGLRVGESLGSSKTVRPFMLADLQETRLVGRLKGVRFSISL